MTATPAALIDQERRIKRRLIGRALMFAYTFDRDSLQDLFARLPCDVRIRAADAVVTKLAAHSHVIFDCTVTVWAAHVLPTAFRMVAGAELCALIDRRRSHDR